MRTHSITVIISHFDSAVIVLYPVCGEDCRERFNASILDSVDIDNLKHKIMETC